MREITMEEYTTNQPIGGTVSFPEEVLQSKCPRCNQRWIIHDCPKINASKVIKLAEEIINKPNVLDSCLFAKREFQKFKDKILGGKFPVLVNPEEMIKKLSRGAVLQENGENADFFCSIKQDGEEFNVYVKEQKNVG